MRGVFGALCLSVLLPSGALAQQEPTEMLSGLYVGQRNETTLHVEVRGDSLVLMDPNAISLARLSHIERVKSDPKGTHFEWSARLFVLQTLSRSGESERAHTMLSEMNTFLSWQPAQKELTLCMSPKRTAVNPRPPTPNQPRHQCLTLTRLSGDQASIPAVPAKEANQPKVDVECQRACRTQIHGKDAAVRLKACEAACVQP